MSRNILFLQSFAGLLLLLLVGSVDSSILFERGDENDPCRKYKTCASCTGSRYHDRYNSPPFTSTTSATTTTTTKKSNNNHHESDDASQQSLVDDDDDDGSTGGGGGGAGDNYLSRNLRHTNNVRPNQQRTKDSATAALLLDDDVENLRSEEVRRRRKLAQRFPSPPICVWCQADNTCSSESARKPCLRRDAHADPDAHPVIGHVTRYEYNCPLTPSHPSQPPEFLPNWMGELLNRTSTNSTNSLFGSLTLLDISLPGTHDSLSYDLSRIVSDAGIDNVTTIDSMLHVMSGGYIKIMPNEMGEFLRLQAKTQQLSLMGQLDNGVRFLDFRIMMEYGSKEWYSLHFMQSRHPVTYYLQQIRHWIDAHPTEILVLWLSKHGVTHYLGQQQYPHVSISHKRSMWRTYMQIFNGLLIDTRISTLNETSIQTLLQRNHRIITYVSDYDEFTNSSHHAIDARIMLDNWWKAVGVFDEPSTLTKQRTYFHNVPQNNAQWKTKGNGLTLMSMNTGAPGWQILYAAQRRFLPHLLRDNVWECASKMSIPGVWDWCPDTLLDVVQLASYYNQIGFEEAYRSYVESSKTVVDEGDDDVGNAGGRAAAAKPAPAAPAFPHAFYLDALDYGGTVRVGSQLLFGADRTSSSQKKGDDDEKMQHKHARYGFVDTVLAYNARVACSTKSPSSHGSNESSSKSDDDRLCDSLIEYMERRRLQHPIQLWNEPELGRLSDWPPLPPTPRSTLRTMSNDIPSRTKRKPTTLTRVIQEGWRYKTIVFPQFTFSTLCSVVSGWVKRSVTNFFEGI